MLLEVVEANAVLGLESVGLVLDADDGLVVAGGDVRVGDAGLGHHEDDAGTLSSSDRTFNAQLFDGVGGVANAGSVNEAEGNTVEVDGVFDGIAGGALDVGYDGTLFTQQGIEQGGLAHVWSSDYGYGDAILKGVARIEAMGEMVDVGFDGLGEG